MGLGSKVLSEGWFQTVETLSAPPEGQGPPDAHSPLGAGFPTAGGGEWVKTSSRAKIIPIPTIPILPPQRPAPAVVPGGKRIPFSALCPYISLDQPEILS